MSAIFDFTIEGVGTVAYVRDGNVADARKWARKAFRGTSVSVSRRTGPRRPCSWCGYAGCDRSCTHRRAP
jgi:hypothetical protein